MGAAAPRARCFATPPEKNRAHQVKHNDLCKPAVVDSTVEEVLEAAATLIFYEAEDVSVAVRTTVNPAEMPRAVIKPATRALCPVRGPLQNEQKEKGEESLVLAPSKKKDGQIKLAMQSAR